MSDTKVSAKPYIIGSTNTAFVVPSITSPPSYVLLNNPPADVGSGGPGQQQYSVTIPADSAMIVVAVSQQNPFTVSSVDIGGHNFAQDVVANNLGTGGTTAYVFSIQTSVVGTGAVTVTVTASGGFATCRAAIWSLTNVTGLVGGGTISNIANTQASPFGVGSASFNANDVLFCVGAADGGGATIDTNNSTQAPLAGDTFSETTFNHNVLAAWHVTSTGSFTYNLQNWSGNAGISAVLAGYR